MKRKTPQLPIPVFSIIDVENQILRMRLSLIMGVLCFVLVVPLSAQNRPPVFDRIGDRITSPGTTLSFQVNATDPDGDRLDFSAQQHQNPLPFSKFLWHYNFHVPGGEPVWKSFSYDIVQIRGPINQEALKEEFPEHPLLQNTNRIIPFDKEVPYSFQLFPGGIYEMDGHFTSYNDYSLPCYSGEPPWAVHLALITGSGWDDFPYQFLEETWGGGDYGFTLSWRFQPAVFSIEMFTQGPHGVQIPRKNRFDADHTIIVLNDNFEEQRMFAPDQPDPDLRDGLINISKDTGYHKMVLKAPVLGWHPHFSSNNRGMLKLDLDYNGHVFATDQVFLNVYTEDGQYLLTAGDFTLDLNNPQGPLLNATTDAGVTLLVEGKVGEGYSNLKLLWSYEIDGQSIIEDHWHFHLASLDFQHAALHSGFDDNNEEAMGAVPHRAIMIPLPPGGQGQNQVNVVVRPAHLRERVLLEVLDSTVASSPSRLGTAGPITLTGHRPDSTNLVARFENPDGQVIAEGGRIYVDVKPRLPADPAASIEIAIVLVKDTEETRFPDSIPASTILDFLNNQTWGPQANVFLSVASGPQTIEVDYDVQNDGLDRSDTEVTSIVLALPPLNSSISIIYVSKFNETDLNGFQTEIDGKNLIFLKENALLDTIAHEIGHALGLDATLGQGHSRTSTDVMGYRAPNAPLRKQIRRYDWQTVNPIHP